MQINEWLESKNIKKLDHHTLEALEEFIGGTQISIAAESVQQAKDYNAWVRENTLTKREQFAGFALIGLASNLKSYSNLDYVRNDAYTIADEMLDAGEE